MSRSPSASEGLTPNSEEIFDEPWRYRYMRLGLPAGLTFFVVIALWLGQGFGVAAAVVAVLVVVIAQATALALLTLHQIVLTDEGVVGETLLGQKRIPWSGLASLEIVDRGGLAVPRRLLRLGFRGGQLFVFDSMTGFDRILSQIAKTPTRHEISEMPLWRRLLLLQWGV